MKKLPALVLAGALAAGGVMTLGVGSAQALGSTVDIRVEHRLQGTPRVLEAFDVTPGPGKELTVADETFNDANWGGNVDVDINPVAQTITVEVANSDCFAGIVVDIYSDEILDVTKNSDTLWADPPAATSFSVGGGVTSLDWLQATDSSCTNIGSVGSKAVFSYEALAVPTMSSATVGGTATAATRTVSWIPSGSSSTIEAYQVIVKRGSKTVLTKVVGPGTKSLTLSSGVLSLPGSYTASVKAFNAAGPSVPKVKAFTVTAVKPGAVGSLAVSGSSTSSKRTVAWKAPAFTGHSPITGYRVVVKKGTKTVVSTTVTGKSIVLKKSALAGGSYKVTVSAKNAKGTGAGVTKSFSVKK